jgi:hypothetical protein
MTDSATALYEGEAGMGAGHDEDSAAQAGQDAGHPAADGAGALPQAPFGSWPSPITAADVARGRVRLSFPTVIGADLWWQEGLPSEGGRITVMHRGPDGKQRALLPAPWNARTRVHEYGGLVPC